jgi:hypothetical protein
MATVLLLAGVYNLAWGTWVVLFPTLSFAHSGLDQPGKPLDYPQLWQCIGMIVGVYGVGYLAAATNPVVHWPVVLVGFLGKLFGPLGYVYGVLVGQTRAEAIATILFNDLVWWVPFFLILRRAYLIHVREEGRPVEPLADVLADLRVPLDGRTLLVFLRHLGCTYCREAVADLATARKQIEADGTRIVLVHTADPAEMTAFLPRYGLGDLPHAADPTGRLYRAAGLGRAMLHQWLWSRTAFARFPAVGIGQGHGVGWLKGDGLRLAGLVLLDGGRVVRTQHTTSTGDRLDFCGVAGR